MSIFENASVAQVILRSVSFLLVVLSMASLSQVFVPDTLQAGSSHFSGAILGIYEMSRDFVFSAFGLLRPPSGMMLDGLIAYFFTGLVVARIFVAHSKNFDIDTRAIRILMFAFWPLIVLYFVPGISYLADKRYAKAIGSYEAPVRNYGAEYRRKLSTALVRNLIVAMMVVTTLGLLAPIEALAVAN